MNGNNQNGVFVGPDQELNGAPWYALVEHAGDKPDQPSRPLDPRKPTDPGRVPGINAPEMPDPNPPPQPEKAPNPLDYPDGQQGLG